MAKVLNRLIELQRGAQPTERRNLFGPQNAATQIWKLTDNGVIILQGKIKPGRSGASPFVFDTVERVEKPFNQVLGQVKRRYTLLRKREGAPK